jgi:hypothetical protein
MNGMIYLQKLHTKEKLLQPFFSPLTAEEGKI